MKKLNKNHFNNFVKKNAENLYMIVYQDFNGMVDMVEKVDQPEFKKVVKVQFQPCRDVLLRDAGDKLKIAFRDGNSFDPYENDEYQGIEVYNCCGKFVVAVKKAA